MLHRYGSVSSTQPQLFPHTASLITCGELKPSAPIVYYPDISGMCHAFSWMGEQFCQRYFSLLLPCTLTGLGVQPRSYRHGLWTHSHECLNFTYRSLRGLVMKLLYRVYPLPAVPNCVQDGTHFQLNGAAETLRRLSLQ